MSSYVKVIDNDRNPLVLDTYKGLVTIPIAHSKIHTGEHYVCTQVITAQASNTATWYGIRTPDTTTTYHMNLDMNFTGEGEIQLFEGGTFTAGTTLISYSLNRQLSVTANLIIASSVTVSASETGTSIFHYRTGFRSDIYQAPFLEQSGGEFLLAAATDYIVKVVPHSDSATVSNLFNYWIA